MCGASAIRIFSWKRKTFLTNKKNRSLRLFRPQITTVLTAFLLKIVILKKESWMKIRFENMALNHFRNSNLFAIQIIASKPLLKMRKNKVGLITRFLFL